MTGSLYSSPPPPQGIISGFVPSVLSLKQEDIGAAGMGRYGSGPSRSMDAGPGGYGRGGHMGQGMRQGYGGHIGSYNSGGGLQMGLSQVSRGLRCAMCVEEIADAGFLPFHSCLAHYCL